MSSPPTLPPLHLVEDDAVMASLVQATLRAAGLANPVVVSGGVADAQRRLLDAEGSLAASPALLLLDLHLPDGSGLDIVRWVRARPALADVPIVVLTGSATVGEVNLAHRLGVDSYLVKPVGVAALRDVLHHLGRPWALIEGRAAPRSPVAPRAPHPRRSPIASPPRAPVAGFRDDDLVRALRDRQLHMVFQPVVDLDGLVPVGAEALVRWVHNGALVSPSDFVAVAERLGCVDELGRLVLDAAIAASQRWHGAQSRPHVAVNVSPLHVASGELVGDVERALAARSFDPHDLVIEVTETALAAGGGVEESLSALRALGVRIAIDDFGTGHSSLARLQALPIDVIKIDRSFVQGIASEDEEWALATAVVRMANALEKDVVAEGIENAAQLAHLRALGVRLGQGFLLSPPLDQESISRVFAEGTMPERPETFAPLARHIPVFDAGRLTSLRLGDEARGVVEEFLTDARRWPMAVEASLREGDLASVATECHRWKTTSAMFGGARTAALLRELERHAIDGDVARATELASTLGLEVRALRASLEEWVRT